MNPYNCNLEERPKSVISTPNDSVVVEHVPDSIVISSVATYKTGRSINSVERVNSRIKGRIKGRVKGRVKVGFRVEVRVRDRLGLGS